MSESFRPVPGFADYEIGDKGTVVSIKRGGRRRLVTRANVRNGYVIVDLSRASETGRGHATRYVHHLILEAFVGPRPIGQVVRHLDGDVSHNRLNNLAWGTPGEDLLDQVSHGTHAQARKTHCPQGHEYSEDHTYRYRKANGGFSRHCRTCLGERDRQRTKAYQDYSGRAA